MESKPQIAQVGGHEGNISVSDSDPQILLKKTSKDEVDFYHKVYSVQEADVLFTFRKYIPAYFGCDPEANIIKI